MEDEKESSTTAYVITIIDTVTHGKISANISGSGRICIQLRYGRIKIRAGDDHLTGSFSSIKRDFTSPGGRIRTWRACHFGEITAPEPGEQSHIGIEGVPYEIFIACNASQKSSSTGSEELHMSRGTMFFRTPHTDMMEKFIPHVCDADCMRECPGGVWQA